MLCREAFKLLVVHAKVHPDLADECVPNLTFEFVLVVGVRKHRFAVEHNIVWHRFWPKLAAVGERHPAVDGKHLEAAVCGAVFNRDAHIGEHLGQIVGEQIHLVCNEGLKFGFWD